MKNNKNIIINHKRTQITNNEVEKFSLNFSRCTYSSLIPVTDGRTPESTPFNCEIYGLMLYVFALSFPDNCSGKLETRCKRLKHCAKKLIKGRKQRFGNLSVTWVEVPTATNLTTVAYFRLTEVNLKSSLESSCACNVPPELSRD